MALSVVYPRSQNDQGRIRLTIVGNQNAVCEKNQAVAHGIGLGRSGSFWPQPPRSIVTSRTRHANTP